ncbi:ran binding protein [Cystoisospora suis]|uniref:Ran binding protein n=1 Tax=Cystoisospora suis TaxID=483139 RepID=A0A2C6L5R4_9APIC|nr:ran binding protein [Cystoisospora suis]
MVCFGCLHLALAWLFSYILSLAFLLSFRNAYSCCSLAFAPLQCGPPSICLSEFYRHLFWGALCFWPSRCVPVSLPSMYAPSPPTAVGVPPPVVPSGGGAARGGSNPAGYPPATPYYPPPTAYVSGGGSGLPPPPPGGQPSYIDSTAVGDGSAHPGMVMPPPCSSNMTVRGGPPSLRGLSRGGGPGGVGGRGGMGPPAGGVVGGRPRKEGDWECEDPACGNVNFSKRTRCNRCGKSRPKTGDPLKDIPNLGGPPGLFKHGDWPCTHCGNVNWARRSTCNICSAPKPNSQDEPRMGRGGGHFDLQDPADRKRHDSDDEDFDEFGRRKRKHHHQNGTAAGQPAGTNVASTLGNGPLPSSSSTSLGVGGGVCGAATSGVGLNSGLPSAEQAGGGGGGVATMNDSHDNHVDQNGNSGNPAAGGELTVEDPSCSSTAAPPMEKAIGGMIGGAGGAAPAISGAMTPSSSFSSGMSRGDGRGDSGIFGGGESGEATIKLAFPPAPKRRPVVASSSSSSSSSDSSDSSRSPSRSNTTRRGRRSRSRSSSRTRRRRRSGSREADRQVSSRKERR